MYLMQPESILNHAKQIFIKAYEHICISHQKFYQELLKFQYDKQTTLQKIINLSRIHQLILIQLCTHCQNLNLGEVGKFAMKMHLQNIQITKWIIQNSSQFAISLPTCAPVYEIPEQKNFQSKEKLQDEIPDHFYRIKQNSLFMAEGISQQIAEIQSSLQKQRSFQHVEVKNLLNNRQLIQRIQPSDNQQLLYEAVDIISHHSEVFKKLAKDNKENFANTYKNLNLKPYSKLKIEIDEAMKEKVVKANEKLFLTLDKFISKKNGTEEPRDKVTAEVQVNFGHLNEQKLLMQDKMKTEKIKELTLALNHEKNRVEKLQQVLRQKINFFEKRLIQARFQKNKQNQIALLKKSLTEITSITNLKSEIDHEAGEQHELNSREKLNEIKKSVKFTKAGAKLNKKPVLKSNQEDAYQKTLMRIKFNIQDEIEDDNQLSQQQQQTPKSKRKICNLETFYCFNPKESFISKNLSSRSIEQYRSYIKSRFSFCHHVYDYDINTSAQLYKNPSMLTITNIKQVMGRKDQNEAKFMKISNSADRPAFINTGQRIGKKKQKSNLFSRVSYQGQNQLQEAMISIANKFPKSQTHPESDEKMDEAGADSRQKMSEFKKVPVDKFKAKNNFQILYLNSDDYTKNNGRINAMMNELKKKRYCRSGVSQYKKYKNQGEIYESQLQPATLLSLYLTEENAMEAELEFSVSTATLVADRKNNKETVNPLPFQQKNEDYFEQMCKKILRAMHLKRKKDSKIYIQIQNAIKHPFSIIQGRPLSKLQMKQYLSEHEIVNFMRFVTNLHLGCGQRPCHHLRQFLLKLGLQII